MQTMPEEGLWSKVRRMIEGLRTLVLTRDGEVDSALYQEFDVTEDYLLVQIMWQEICWCCGSLRTAVGIVTAVEDGVGGWDGQARGFGLCLVDISLGEICPHNAEGAGEGSCQYKDQHDARCKLKEEEE